MTIPSTYRDRRLVALMTFAGIVEVAVGALHFAMPLFYRRSAGLDDLGPAEADYVLLVTLATGVLLIAFGIVTLGAPRMASIPYLIIFGYLVVQCILWAARLLLEILFPLRLAMFGVDPFTMVVAPGLVVELVVFIAAAHRARVLHATTTASVGR